MSDSAADAMSRNPKTIGKDAWATEALRLMEERKITSLFVVAADGRPEGILHLHDLWGVESI
jgi:arabinose-5-phosphate isomerase